MPERRQHEIAELWSGRIQTHSFFATRRPAVAPYGDAAFVPYLFHEPVTGPELAKIFARSRGQPFVLDHQWSGVSVRVTPGPHVPAILERIDGRRTFGAIFAEVRALPAFRGAPPGDAALFDEFREAYEVLNAIDRLLLVHPDHPLPPRPA
jgi:hypothetical protein